MKWPTAAMVLPIMAMPLAAASLRRGESLSSAREMYRSKSKRDKHGGYTPRGLSWVRSQPGHTPLRHRAILSLPHPLRPLSLEAALS